MSKVMKWINSKRNILGILLLVVLSLFLIDQVLDFNRMLALFNSPIHDERDLHYTVERGEYYSLLNKVAHNEILNDTIFTDTTEYAALAKYYQAAVYYKAYRGKDQTEADHYLHTMTENEKKISSVIMKDALKELKQYLHL